MKFTEKMLFIKKRMRMSSIKNGVGTNRRRKTEDSPLSLVRFSRMYRCLFSVKTFLSDHNFTEDDVVKKAINIRSQSHRRNVSKEYLSY